MTEQQDTLSITIRFGTWTLPMTIHRADEYVYRQAERHIRERYNFYTNNYPGQPTEMYLVMTVLDMAVLLKQQEESHSDKPYIDRLEPLLKELESALESNQMKEKKK